MITARILATDGETSVLYGQRMFHTKEEFVEAAQQWALYDNGAAHYLIDMGNVEVINPNEVQIGDHVILTSEDLRQWRESRSAIQVIQGKVTAIPDEEGYIGIDDEAIPIATEGAVLDIYRHRVGQ